MKRRLALVACMVLAAAVLFGCDNVEVDSPEAGTGSESSASTTASTVSLDGLDAMSVEGPGEAAAVAALPDALEQAKQTQEQAGLAWSDVSGLTPRFTAYLLAVEMGGQTALFEVRADGRPHGLYAYQQAFDAGTLVWTASENAGSPRAAAQSDPERSAVAAIETAMRDAFPDQAFSTSVYGYRFVYLEDDSLRHILEVATDGSVISTGL